MTELEKSIDKYNIYFSDKYEKYVGDLEGLSIIDQYARINAYWIMELDIFEKKSFKSDIHKQVYYAYAKSGFLNIKEKTVLLSKKTRCKIAEKITKLHVAFHMKMKLDEITRIAFELHNKTIKEERYKEIPDPNRWLSIEDKMRSIWRKYEKEFIDEDDDVCNRYMKFMYKNFPENFGKMLKTSTKCPEEIYYELVYKKNNKSILDDIIEV